ncbi:MAG: uncharacterized protein KVP18_005148 [Porospora cf. gigantea A]|uniref:uncharacterized protein n=1 Tax=Porospora cf. gigantea A TaxID=2853593 RepID=UPI0035595D08|nr:MAG: hypothetical protein KVP18_005148 [Porospora cf. gigantea A]
MDEWESTGAKNSFSLVRFGKELLSSSVRYLSDIGVDDTKTLIIDYRAFLSQLKSPECAPIVALLRKQVDAIVSCRKTDEVGDRFQKAVDASCSALARQATLKHVPAELLTEHTEAFIAAKVAPHVLRLVETTPLRLEDQRLQKNLNVLRVFGLTLTQLEVDELLLPHKLRAPLLSMVGELLAATKANTVGKVSNVEAGPSFSSRLAPKLQSSGSECHRVCP